MLGSSKESSNMQSLNFTTPCNRLALLVNPKPQQPIKYFPVFTWNRVGNRTSAEASNSRQLVWLNVVQEQEGGGSVRGGAGHIVLVFPKPGEMQHRRSSSQAQGYLSPFLLWSHSPAGRPPASGDFPSQHKADQPPEPHVTFQVRSRNRKPSPASFGTCCNDSFPAPRQKSSLQQRI